VEPVPRIVGRRFLRDLFLAHDLKPRSPFRLHTEQIDGAFELDGTYFIVEAKWEKERVGHRPLDSFAREVERRLDNTLGLFVALSGFTEEGLEAVRKSRPTIILFDGQDLAIVLQGLEDFVELLRRKIRHAAQTGDPYLRAGAAP
jgi:Restriction endonuclease